jgi:hypothetical protein
MPAEVAQSHLHEENKTAIKDHCELIISKDIKVTNAAAKYQES